MYPSLAVQGGAVVATRWFVVDAQDPAQVLSAIGLPGVGDTHPSASSIRVVDREPTRAGPATTFVRVVYRFDAVAGTPAPDPDNIAEDGDAYTEILPSIAQFEARTDINGKLLPQPVSLEAPAQEIVVHVYTNGPVSDAAITDFLPLRAKINDNPVTFPPRWTHTSKPVAAPGMLLARTFTEETVREGLTRVSFRFGLAPSQQEVLGVIADGWQSVLRGLDSYGNATGDPIVSDVYQSVNFDTSNLWTA